MKKNKCLNCGSEFKKSDKNHKYCSGKCYWEYHLKDILKKGSETNETKRD